MTEHCYVRTCDEAVVMHMRGASFCSGHGRAALLTGFEPEIRPMPPCPTDEQPRVTDEHLSPPQPHVHPPLWHEVATAAGTYMLAAVLLAAASLVLGATCGAGVLGYRLVSEVAR